MIMIIIDYKMITIVIDGKMIMLISSVYCDNNFIFFTTFKLPSLL